MDAAEDFSPSNEFKEVNPETVPDKSLIYKMLISAITPRPIAFVSSMTEDGVSNVSHAFWEFPGG
jgi:hypothetical protein